MARPGPHEDERNGGLDGDGLQQRLDVARDLASIARLALAAPGCDVASHARPHKPGFDEPLRGPHPWVGQVVNGIEQHTVMRGGYQRAGGPC